MTGHFNVPFEKKRHGFFFQKKYVLFLKWNNQYLFFSVPFWLITNPCECAWNFSKTKCSKKSIFEKLIEMKQRTNSWVILCDSVIGINLLIANLKLQNTLKNGYFQIIVRLFFHRDYLCTHTHTHRVYTQLVHNSKTLSLSFFIFQQKTTKKSFSLKQCYHCLVIVFHLFLFYGVVFFSTSKPKYVRY